MDVGKSERNNVESYMIAVWQFMLACIMGGELFFKNKI
jgi:hypothetical protein